MENVLGEKAAKIIALHVELNRYVDDPGELHKHLFNLLGYGAFAIEKMIIKELVRRLDIYYEISESDFAKSIAEAKRLFIEKLVLPPP